MLTQVLKRELFSLSQAPAAALIRTKVFAQGVRAYILQWSHIDLVVVFICAYHQWRQILLSSRLVHLVTSRWPWLRLIVFLTHKFTFAR